MKTNLLPKLLLFMLLATPLAITAKDYEPTSYYEADPNEEGFFTKLKKKAKRVKNAIAKKADEAVEFVKDHRKAFVAAGVAAVGIAAGATALALHEKNKGNDNSPEKPSPLKLTPDQIIEKDIRELVTEIESIINDEIPNIKPEQITAIVTNSLNTAFQPNCVFKFGYPCDIFAPHQFNVLTPVQIQAIPSKAFSKVSDKIRNAMTPQQLQALTPEQTRNLNFYNFLVLLNLNQVKSIDFTYTPLTPGMSGFVDIRNLSPDQIIAFTYLQLKVFGGLQYVPSQLEAMTEAQKDAMNAQIKEFQNSTRS